MENPKGNNRLMVIGENEYAIYSLISSSRLAFDKHTKLTSYTRGYEIIHQFHNPLLAQVDFINLTDRGAAFCLLMPWADQALARKQEGNNGDVMILSMN